MGHLIDLSGQTFGRLTVVGRGASRKNETRAFWICKCECGRETTVSGKYLRGGNTKSCGCLGAEKASAWMSSETFSKLRIDASTTHGHKRTSGMSLEYRTWLTIKSRCYAPKSKDFPKYGGRGIRVSDEWANSFETFLADMGPRPSPSHQIDRKDSYGNYCKDNCRWVTPLVQRSENRRDLRSITIQGIFFHSISAACRHFGISKTTVNYRLKSSPLSEEVFTAPVRKYKHGD